MDTHIIFIFIYDDVIKWKHFLPRYWPFVRGIHQSPVDYHQKGQWCRALMFFFYVHLNKRLSKQSRCWWFETSWHSSWRHYSGLNRHAENTYFSNALIISDGSVTTDICIHYGDVIMGEIASQVTSLTIVYSTFYSDADQRKHQSSASLAFVCGIHRGPVNSPHKWPVTRKMFPFDDVIMIACFFNVFNDLSYYSDSMIHSTNCIFHSINQSYSDVQGQWITINMFFSGRIKEVILCVSIFWLIARWKYILSGSAHGQLISKSV